MEHPHWSPSEKKIAHAVFDAALERELEEILANFKRKAADVSSAEEMWALQEYLRESERDFQTKYDFRYSQLPFVFGRLLREGRISEADLHGLAQDKLVGIRRVADL